VGVVAGQGAGLRLGHHLLATVRRVAKAGMFEQLQALLLDEFDMAGRLDLDRVSVDSFSLRAVKGAPLCVKWPASRCVPGR
jgi:hypothetical protein